MICEEAWYTSWNKIVIKLVHKDHQLLRINWLDSEWISFRPDKISARSPLHPKNYLHDSELKQNNSVLIGSITLQYYPLQGHLYAGLFHFPVHQRVHGIQAYHPLPRRHNFTPLITHLFSLLQILPPQSPSYFVTCHHFPSVTVHLHYLPLTHTAVGLQFISMYAILLKASLVNTLMCKCSSALRLHSHSLHFHAFCIRMTSRAAALGAPDDVITMMGWWSSGAYRNTSDAMSID